MPSESTPFPVNSNVARLLITCPDQPGLVAAVTNFLFNHNANITDLDQHSTDPEGGKLFMRLEFQTPHLDVSKSILCQAFADRVASLYEMEWQINFSSKPQRTAILVSKHDHALQELLWRWSRGELATEIGMVISNHPDLKDAVERFGIPYHHVTVEKDNKADAEQKILDLLKDGDIDLVVLARYMQILSDDFVQHYPNKIINIHHSFLPAFVGANPYQQAYDQGVKLIGATSHYVTGDLDQGPIIEQAVLRISHKDTAITLKEKGRDIERQVLARAVNWHLEDRIIVDGRKTIVFD